MYLFAINDRAQRVEYVWLERCSSVAVSSTDVRILVPASAAMR